nr:allophanate hydrolase subunit 2 family protein [Verrucosispora sioxanthis]
MSGLLEVLRAGALTTVQDLGRPGWAHLGVPRSGALDPAALRLANRLVGNPEQAAGLEITLTGCELRPTRELPLGAPAGPPAPVDLTVPVAYPTELRLNVRLGPRHDWFTPAALDRLLGTAYQVSPLSNRVGARLSGAPLPRSVAGELPSEGLVLGAVQVPADGQPLVFLADHPTTGGYPVIAVVADVTPLAQARPGTTVRFHGPQR